MQSNWNDNFHFKNFLPVKIDSSFCVQSIGQTFLHDLYHPHTICIIQLFPKMKLVHQSEFTSLSEGKIPQIPQNIKARICLKVRQF